MPFRPSATATNRRANFSTACRFRSAPIPSDTAPCSATRAPSDRRPRNTTREGRGPRKSYKSTSMFWALSSNCRKTKPSRSTMSTKANLTELLAESGGSARHRKAAIRQPAHAHSTAPTQKGRGGTSPITVHFPKQVRDQLKILAVQSDKTLHSLVAEAFNDLFAKYGKPEIAPAQTEHPE